MASTRTSSNIAKTATGIAGLDQMTGGGLPVGRTTLLIGGPGTGKTVLSLQALVHGATVQREPGIFVAFEEHSGRIIANAASFGWDLPVLQRKRLFFLDARLPLDTVPSGDFDLNGLLATVGARVDAMGARRIVFDAIDVLFAKLGGESLRLREMHRLHDWLLARELTAIITAKATVTDGVLDRSYAFLPFMTDCAIELQHNVVSGVSHRSLRITKYRGSAFSENASPYMIGESGLEVAGSAHEVATLTSAPSHRISTGVPHLDEMLGGGFFAGSSVLVTGAPGTSKTTLAGAFAEAACKRNEPTLFVSFDSEPAEIVRNLQSVGIRLAPHVRSGVLQMRSLRSGAQSAEAQLLEIRGMIHAHAAKAVVIDPISALGKLGNEQVAHGVVERLVDSAKAVGATILCTSLLGGTSAGTEGTPIEISTIADTWIHLTYLAQGGERNRALTVIKSRGTAHSNQVRELLLSSKGVAMADVYTAEGEVLMGNMRHQREAKEAEARTLADAELARRRRQIESATDLLAAKMQELQREMAAQQKELEYLEAAATDAQDALGTARVARRRQRGETTPEPHPPGRATPSSRKKAT